VNKENEGYISTTINTKHLQFKVVAPQPPNNTNNVRMNSNNRQQLIATTDAMSSDIAFDTSSDNVLKQQHQQQQQEPTSNYIVDAEMSCIDPLVDDNKNTQKDNILLDQSQQ
jgi:hypothetical protein